MSGWVELQIFFRISLIYHFSSFPYLLLYRRMSSWADLNIFIVSCLFSTSPFFPHVYLLIFRIFLLTYYFFEECQAELTSTIVSLISQLWTPTWLCHSSILILVFIPQDLYYFYIIIIIITTFALGTSISKALMINENVKNALYGCASAC